MAARVELENAPSHVVALQLAPAHRGVGGAQVDAGTGQHPRQFLHVFLAVGAIDTQGVQLHQLARQVLIDTVHCVLLVVQVAQHRRVQRRGAQQVTKPAQRVWANGRVFVVTHHGAQVGLVLEHAEVVQPEPSHLLLQLARRVQRAQHMARGRLARQPVQLLLVGLLGGFFGIVVFQGVGIAPALLQRKHQGGKGLLAQRQRSNLALYRRRQRGRAFGQLLVQ